MSKKNARENRTQRAAAALEAERRRNRNRQLITVGGVAAVLVLAVAAFVVFFPGGSDDEVAASPAGSAEVAVAIGDADAPSQVVVYEDFLCPFCGQFEAASADQLEQLAEDGEAYVEYRPINFLSRLGDYSERAANAVAAVQDQEGPAAAKRLHDALFANQPSESGPFPDDDALVDLAVDAGASEETIRPAIEDLEYADQVDAATEQATDDGVTATPTILVDGEQVEGQTIDEVVDNLVSQVQQG